MIRNGSRVIVSGPPNNVVYARTTKALYDKQWEIIGWRVKFEDSKYGSYDEFPLSQIKEA